MKWFRSKVDKFLDAEAIRQREGMLADVAAKEASVPPVVDRQAVLHKGDRIKDGSIWYERLIRGRCGYCNHESMTMGPSGGGSQNLECTNCGALYNHMGPFGFEYLGIHPHPKFHTEYNQTVF